MICSLSKVAAVAVGLTLSLGIAEAGVPDPTMSTTGGPVMLGNARGLPIVPGLPNVLPTIRGGYQVGVYDEGGAPLVGITVTMRFAGTGIQVHAVQTGGQVADCAVNTISVVTDANGRAVFFPATVGENSSPVPNVQIRAGTTLLTTILFRSLDLFPSGASYQGCGTIGSYKSCISIWDLNEFRLRFLGVLGHTNLDPECDFATEGSSAGRVDAFDLNLFRTEFLCGAAVGVAPVPCTTTECP